MNHSAAFDLFSLYLNYYNVLMYFWFNKVLLKKKKKKKKKITNCLQTNVSFIFLQVNHV